MSEALKSLSKSWDDALASFRKSRKSIGAAPEESGRDFVANTQKVLRKAKDSAPPSDDEMESEDEVEDEDEGYEPEEEDDAEDMQKSLEDLMSDDASSDAAMDVAPFLRQLVKSIDSKFEEIGREVKRVAKLQKSMADFAANTAELQKSMAEMVEQIGDQPVRTQSVRALNKSVRFGDEGDPTEIAPAQLLAKSMQWKREGHLTTLEVGKIETRINKGLLFKSGDGLDRKVESLLKGGK